MRTASETSKEGKVLLDDFELLRLVRVLEGDENIAVTSN